MRRKMRKVWYVIKKFLVVGIFIYVCILALVQTIKLHKRDRTIENQNVIIKYYEDLYVSDDKDYQEALNQLKEANQKIAEMQQQQTSYELDDTYINNKFPHDGIYYREAYDEVQFYSDMTCTREIYNVRLMSSAIDSCNAKNGLFVYCLRMDDGKICYCTEMPYLVSEGKYEELHEKN